MVANTKQIVDLGRFAVIEDVTLRQYSPHGVMVHFKPSSHGPSVSIFRTGQMNVAGKIDPREGDKALKDTVRALTAHGLIKQVAIKTRIVNIVVKVNLERQLNIVKLSQQLHNSIYEPELFPGFVHRPSGMHPQAFTMFQSGKVIIAGINNPKAIKASVDYLAKIADEFGV